LVQRSDSIGEVVRTHRYAKLYGKRATEKLSQRISSSAVGLVAVDYKFRVSSAAKFVQVHADALAVNVHTERNCAIDKPKKQIDKRQNKTKQGGDAD
jgi:hypothetical protein